jgi:DNA-binding transcriptional MerR regulator
MRSRPSQPAQFPDGAADVARRFGVTIKTLRLYETAGLLRPTRDGNGWRRYGQLECERIHVVLLLRRFGLTIARIRDFLSADQPDVSALLDLQAEALAEQQGRIGEALSLIEEARRHLTEHGSIDRAALAAIAKAQVGPLRWTPALRRTAARCFTPLQRELLASVTPTIEAEWQAVYRELALVVDGPADTPRARRLGARTASLIVRMTRGDAVMREALTRFWQDGFRDPDAACSLPLDERGWRFLGKAMDAHARQGAGL